MPRYDLSSTTLGSLLEDQEVVAIIEKHAPGLTTNPMLQMATAMPAHQALGMAGGLIGADEVASIEADVRALE